MFKCRLLSLLKYDSSSYTNRPTNIPGLPSSFEPQGWRSVVLIRVADFGLRSDIRRRKNPSPFVECAGFLFVGFPASFIETLDISEEMEHKNSYRRISLKSPYVFVRYDEYLCHLLVHNKS